MPTQKPRITITMTPEQIKDIEKYWKSKEKKNQTQAILDLIEKGLDLEEATTLEFSEEERDHIKKYRALDEHGKESVDVVLDVEYNRCQNAAQPAAIIMMLSGLRRGELSALTWKDIDLKEKTISVSKTVEYPPKGKAFLRRYTKTEAGIRVVYIPQRLVNYLKDLPRKNILVYPSAGGQMMTANAWRAVWGSYMRELNRKYGERTPADKLRLWVRFPSSAPIKKS